MPKTPRRKVNDWSPIREASRHLERVAEIRHDHEQIVLKLRHEIAELRSENGRLQRVADRMRTMHDAYRDGWRANAALALSLASVKD